MFILELVNPTVDEATGTVTYGANILGGYAGEPLTQIVADEAADALPETFDRASLFIDECPALSDCLYIGAHEMTYTSGPIPGGPYQQCWDPGSGACRPCNETTESLRELCKQTYSNCRPICFAG